MQVNIKGKFVDKYGKGELSNLCNFVHTDEQAISWGESCINYFERKHNYVLIELIVYQYKPNDGSERTIKRII